MSKVEEQKTEIINKYNLNSAVSGLDMFNKPRLTMEDRKNLFITYDFIPFPRNSVSLVAATGGSGKTFLTINVACEHILKEYYEYGRESKVLLWLSEDADYIVSDRLSLVTNIVRGYSEEQLEVIMKNLLFWTASDHFPFSFGELHGSKLVENKEIFPLFKEEVEKMGVDLVILDPLLNFFGGEENSNSQARSFINLLNRWATESQKTIILVHHAGKGEGSFSRGASAFADSARFVITLEKIMIEDEETGKPVPSDHPDDKHDRMIVIKKDNYGAPALLHAIGIDSDSMRTQVLPHVFTIEEKKEEEFLDDFINNTYGSSEILKSIAKEVREVSYE